MARHDELLKEGLQQAPEPETAEQRTKRVGWGTAGGGLAAGGLAALKFGGLWKVFVWIFAFRALENGWRIGSWIGLAVVVAAIVAFALVRSRKEAQP